ncbi:MAG: T9SS type A sorting domain-containing protein [bacterium]|nr:T9SS type A sorting domain-containing protein [bacterium]
MKKYLFVFIIIAGTKLFASAPDILWTKTYGGTGDEEALSAQQTSDNGFIIAGTTNSFGAGNLDIYLIKTDSSGNTLWTKTFGGTEDDYAYSVQQTEDGGFIIAGHTNSFGAGNWDIYLIKTDSSGDTLWTRTYGGTTYDVGFQVQQTSDNGFIIAGTTNSFGVGTPDSINVYLIKTDSSGDTLWTKTYGGTSDDWGLFVQQTSDDGFIITGETYSFGKGTPDSSNVYLIKTDSSGDTLWTRTYGGTGCEWGGAVQQTKDNGFIITGGANFLKANYEDVYLIRTDLSGDTLWTKIYGGKGDDWGCYVQQTQDDGFITVGERASFEGYVQDIYLLKTNSSGDTLWTKIFAGGGTDWGNYVHQTFDGGFIIAGLTLSFGAGNGDAYLIKLKPETGIEEKSNINSLSNTLSINQNPFSKSTVITYSVPPNNYYLSTGQASTNTLLTIYDLSGRCVKTLVNESKPAGSYSTTLSAQDLKTGIYFVKFISGSYKETEKLILMK